MDDRKNQYEYKTSRNGLIVPVLNGIHLHSIYNPIKEAEAFASGHLNTIQANANILILGLGFGYHIEQIAKAMSTLYKTYSITVLEPNKELAIEFNQKTPFTDKNISIIATSDIKALFEDYEFISFLRNKPSIIKHDPSFSTNREFYTSFLKYKAPTIINKYMEKLDPMLQTYFQTMDNTEVTVDEKIEAIKTKNGIKNKFDYFMLAFESIKNNQNSRGL